MKAAPLGGQSETARLRRALQRSGAVLWLAARRVVVGQGYRSNAEGIRQLLADDDELVVAPLPRWRGRDECMHLMSLISPVDRDLSVVYDRSD